MLLLTQVGTPRTHRRYLARDDGTYGPIPSRRPLGLLGMPFNTTVSECNETIFQKECEISSKYALNASFFLLAQAVPGLYCVGDSCFPGQGVIAVAFSGIMCGHRVAADLGELQHNSAQLCIKVCFPD